MIVHVHENKEISISLSEPVWVGSSVLVDRLYPSVYSHQIKSEGGYWSCSFSMPISGLDLQLWYESIGGHVVVRGEHLGTIFEGFLNKIDLTIGGLQISRGPLMDTANKVRGVYTKPSYSFSGVTIGGNRGVTSDYEDADSQALYGIHQEELSVGTSSDTEADQAVQTYLETSRRPPVSQTISTGGAANEISLNVEVFGYVHFLEEYLFEDTSSPTTQDLDAKIQAVLAADPNGIFSSNYELITANTTQVDEYEADGKTAMAIIKDLAALGDSSYNKYNWGIYADRRMSYAPVPTEVEYVYSISEQSQSIFTVTDAVILPWNILPGKWIHIKDFLDNDNRLVVVSDDPRVMFIESVTYTMPYQVSLQGGRTDNLPQLLARLGLGAL